MFATTVSRDKSNPRANSSLKGKSRFKAKSWLGAAALCATLVSLSATAANGPFASFAGSWKGEGRVFTNSGGAEPLKCRSSNNPSEDNINLDLSFVCASSTYRFDFHAQLYTDGQALRGTWTEATRNASGNVSGEITPSSLSANISAPGFAANLTVRSAARTLTVSVRPEGTSVQRVEVTMKH